MKIDNFTIKYYPDYAFINIVFTPSSNEVERETFMRMSREFKPVSVCDSEETFNRYFDSIEIMVDDEPDASGDYPVTILSDKSIEPQTMIAENEATIMYLPKFDKFYYREYIQINEITLGAVQFMLNNERIEAPEGYDLFRRALTALDLFWH